MTCMTIRLASLVWIKQIWNVIHIYYITTVSPHAALRSAARGDLVVPRTRRRLGNRAFCVAGPKAWNSLPSDIRTASSLTTFKNLLKTHLFTSHTTQLQLNYEYCVLYLYGALVVTLWTCYGAL